ncbi:MAG: hypothetical protein C0616_11320 [Desulfuromonas sp.]|nr:MAG: hypothetical protein C0616_11320 [Desulfuromonas sp.]
MAVAFRKVLKYLKRETLMRDITMGMGFQNSEIIFTSIDGPIHVAVETDLEGKRKGRTLGRVPPLCILVPKSTSGSPSNTSHKDF